MNSPATRAALVRQTATDFDAAIQAKTFCIEVGAVGKEGFFVEAYGDVLAGFDLDEPGNWTSRRLRHNCSKADFELLN